MNIALMRTEDGGHYVTITAGTREEVQKDLGADGEKVVVFIRGDEVEDLREREAWEILSPMLMHNVEQEGSIGSALERIMTMLFCAYIVEAQKG
jgi:hypothetical protein